jgi:hypothetical protein
MMGLVPPSPGEQAVWKRIFGAALFVWMGGTAILSAKDMLSHQGVRDATEIASIVAFAAMALIGLVMAITPAKRLSPNDKDAGENVSPDSS